MTLSIIFIILGIIFCTISIFVGIISHKKNNNKLAKKYYIKTIFVIFGLMILSVIACILYWKLFHNLLISKWSLISIGIIVMVAIFFLNFVGLLFLIFNPKNIYLTVISYGIIMVSTLLTYNIIIGVEKLLRNKEIVISYSSPILFALMVIIENICSYIIANKITGIKNITRGNYA